MACRFTYNGQEYTPEAFVALIAQQQGQTVDEIVAEMSGEQEKAIADSFSDLTQNASIQRALQGGTLSPEMIEAIRKDPRFQYESPVLLDDMNRVLDELMANNGLADATKVAKDPSLPDWFRIMLAGRVNDALYAMEKAAPNEIAASKVREQMADMFDIIKQLGSSAGRTLKFIQEMYKQSPIGYSQYIRAKVSEQMEGSTRAKANQVLNDKIANAINNTTPEEVQQTAEEAIEAVFDDSELTEAALLQRDKAELAEIEAEIAIIKAQEERRKFNEKRGKTIGQSISMAVSSVTGMGNNANKPLSDVQKRLAELEAKKKELEGKIAKREGKKPSEKKPPSTEKNLLKETLINAGFGKTIKRNGKDVQTVDWKSIISDSKTAAQAKEAIYNKLKELAGEEAANNMREELDAVFDMMLADKKMDAVNKIIEGMNKKGLTPKQRHTVSSKLINLINLNGGATGNGIANAIGNIIGTNPITPQQAATVDTYVSNYLASQPGFNRDRAMERLTRYINEISNGRAWEAIATIRQHYIMGLVSGVLTTVKNATVAFDLIRQTMQEFVRSGFDPKVFDFATQGMNEGMQQFLTVTQSGYNGRTAAVLDVESDGRENKTPRLAEHIDEIYGNSTVAKIATFLTNLWNSAKYVNRFNEGVDSYFGSVSANVRRYTLMKQLLQKEGLTRKQAAVQAYRDLYITYDQLESAKQKAKAEYDNLKKNATPAMIERRAYEIIEQNKFLKVGENDVTKRVVNTSEETANQTTYKRPGMYGLTHAIPTIINAIRTMYAGAKSEEGYRGKKIIAPIAEIVDMGMDTLFAFANIGANVTEASLDWTPIYGTGKMLGAYIMKERMRGKGNEKKAIQFETALREIQAKQAIMIALSAVAFAAFMLGSDDDEEKVLNTMGIERDKEGKWFVSKKNPILSGTGGEWVRKNTQLLDNKQRTIFGDYTVDLMGSLQTALVIMADYRDLALANPDKSFPKQMQNAIAAYESAVLSQSVARSFSDIDAAIRNIGEQSSSKFFEKKLATLGAGTILPAQGMSKQINDLKGKPAKEVLDFWEMFKHEGGAYSDWAVEDTKFDWRGREYKVGDMYASNLGGIMSALHVSSPLRTADAIDKWAVEKKVKTVNPRTQFEDSENDIHKYTMVTADGKPQEMDIYEDYKFRKNAAKIFNTYIEKLWDSKRVYMEGLSEKDAQKEVSDIWDAAKMKSAYELNKSMYPDIKWQYPDLKSYKDRFKKPEEIKEDEDLNFELTKSEIIENIP